MKERPLSERFQDVWLILRYRPGVYSGQICDLSGLKIRKCIYIFKQVHFQGADQTVINIYKYIIKKWQSELNVMEANKEDSRREEGPWYANKDAMEKEAMSLNLVAVQQRWINATTLKHGPGL